jgi:hypothetical protein
MLSRRGMQMGTNVLAGFVGLVAILFTTTPANACYYCVGGPVYTCEPAPPMEGYISCTNGISYCVVAGVCNKWILDNIDIDGQPIATSEAIVAALLRTVERTPDAAFLADYLSTALDPTVLNCRGLAIARLGGVASEVNEPSDISL